MDAKRLWAKSCPKWAEPHPSMYLPQHLKDVYAAAGRILDATGDAQLVALGLDADRYRERFRRCVLLAAAVHDLGKANDHFQGMICGKRDVRVYPQGLRHEWVTVLMLQYLKPWLLPAVSDDETDFAIVEWAVAGHHPAQDHESPPGDRSQGAGASLSLRVGDRDFRDCVTWLGEKFNSRQSPPTVSSQPLSLVGLGNVYQRLTKWSRDALERWDSLKQTDDAKLVPAVKNCVVAADVAGSALPKKGPPDWDRITTALRSIPSADDLAFLADYGRERRIPRPFQTTVAEYKSDVVFVKAGCGTGKTVAAYMRAAKQWKGRRLYFCYPTTGTATEGFKDYLHPDLPESTTADTPQAQADRERLRRINADLFHSRSGVDFEIILGTGGDVGKPDADAAARGEALHAWATPVVACTVDTVLGLVQNNKRGLFGWPAISQSAFVFDEIHAYDDRLFGALLRFLRDVPGVPTLLMTASLPKPREKALREELKKFRGIALDPISGPDGIERMARYHKAADDGKHLELIAAEVKNGGKVLWVSNTVKRVMDAAMEAEKKGLCPLIYHSRFKYEHRVKRHKDVVEAFDPKETNGVLACTSQVCEMSLDLKGCTLLVTELAPVAALIQRLGRLNRHAEPPEEGAAGPPTMPFVVLALDPKDHLPYTPPDLIAATEWLGKLPDAGISQRMLAEEWQDTANNVPDHVASAWLDGGPATTVTELRKPSPGITVVLKSDAAPIRKYLARIADERRRARDGTRPFDEALLEARPGERHPRDLPRCTIPMPAPSKAVAWREWDKLNGIPVAPDDTVTYDPMRGAEWK